MAGRDVQLLLVGASHRSAPLGLRECMSLDPARRVALDGALANVAGLSGAVVLNTCNRVELYCAAESAEALQAARALFGGITGLEVAGFGRYGYEMTGRAAAQHLMEVCAGLDSQMIGETEIMGQVKQAYTAASERGNVGPVLHRLFQKSFSAAKRAREQSGIGEGQVSLGAVAVELARRIHGDLAASRVMVVGSGQVGAGVAHALRLRGARDIVVASRTPGHADRLALEIGAKAVPFEGWQEHMKDCDIAVLCTSAPTAILGREAAAKIMAQRPARPLFLLDLAMPLDVEPDVGGLSDVFLYTFADLAAMANENLKGRMKEVDQCRSDLAVRASRLWACIQNRGPVRDKAGDDEPARVKGGLR